MTVSIGKQAPAFSLFNQLGKRVGLKDFSSTYTVLYFYPKDDTPGCTLESKGFSSMMGAFRKAGAHVIGISGGDVASKAKFCGKYDLALDLLADTDFATSKKYGAFGEKSFMGRKYQGILRQTFVLDKNKKVLKVFESVKPQGHAEEVLAYLAQAGSRQGLLPFKAAVPAKKKRRAPSIKRSRKASQVAKSKGKAIKRRPK